MARISIKSSNLKAISSYDEKKKRLVVQFRSGAEYSYSGVSKRTVQALLAAPSKTAFLNKRIVPRFRAYQLKPWKGQKK